MQTYENNRIDAIGKAAQRLEKSALRAEKKGDHVKAQRFRDNAKKMWASL